MKCTKLFSIILINIFFINNLFADVERTFSMIKPKAVKNTKAINKMIEQNGLKIVETKKIIFNQVNFNKLYGIHKDKPFFKDLQKEILNKKIVVQIIEGDNAVAKYRILMGNTDPKKADLNTIRHKFGYDKTNNAVHGSDSKENAAKEICIFYNKYC